MANAGMLMSEFFLVGAILFEIAGSLGVIAG
jgi:hypothetical protein